MPRSSRSRSNLSDEEKKKRRREQKKLSMRRARAKLDVASLEERRRKDRERYQRKKQDGLIKTIKDFTPRQQRQMRKMWREKSKLRREKEKIKKRTDKILNDTPPSSPSSSFSRIACGEAVSARNRRRLKAKNEFFTMKLQLLERRLAKYRMQILRLKKNKVQRTTDQVSIKEKIHSFLLDDENSRLTAGKKETITRRKVKKQIRLLNDTLLNLHKIFINKSGLKVSYETFRRHRPFWVIFPTAALRNTCLCSVCTNNDYIVYALHNAKILSYSKASLLAKSLCCGNEPNVACLERKCSQCTDKKVNFNVINGSDTICYERWVTKNITVTIKGITVIPIDDSHVPAIQNIVDAIRVPPFKGTFKIHQISWSNRKPNILHARRLSCMVCAADTKCTHFEIGLIPVQIIQLPRPLSRSTSEASTQSVVASSPGTASASTHTGPGTPFSFRETPSPNSILSVRQPLTPRKRGNFEDFYSDDSTSATSDKLRSVNVFVSDSDNSPPPHLSKPRLAIFDDSENNNSPPKKSKKRLAFFDDSDEENSPPKISKPPTVSCEESDEDIF
ncbi:hypothetical protein ACJJTC_011325 [Scirpophaga incertulas]